MDVKSTIDLGKTEELRFLSMENLKDSKQRPGDLTGHSVTMTGSEGKFSLLQQ